MRLCERLEAQGFGLYSNLGPQPTNKNKREISRWVPAVAATVSDEHDRCGRSWLHGSDQPGTKHAHSSASSSGLCRCCLMRGTGRRVSARPGPRSGAGPWSSRILPSTLLGESKQAPATVLKALRGSSRTFWPAPPHTSEAAYSAWESGCWCHSKSLSQSCHCTHPHSLQPPLPSGVSWNPPHPPDHCSSQFREAEEHFPSPGSPSSQLPLVWGSPPRSPNTSPSSLPVTGICRRGDPRAETGQ